jgi:hypothetical protein
VFQPVHNDQIVMPNGNSYSVREMQAARAVEEYDSSFILGQLNGTWTVFLRNGPIEGNPFPIFALGNELPAPEEIKRRMYHADTKRHGGKIAAKVDRVNEQRKRELRKKADEGVAQTVEAFDFGLRAKGVHPFPKIYVPRGVS